MSRPIIMSLCDFGNADRFVGVVHGVLQSLALEAHIVDRAHAVPPCWIARGTFMLKAACPDLPPAPSTRPSWTRA